MFFFHYGVVDPFSKGIMEKKNIRSVDVRRMVLSVVVTLFIGLVVVSLVVAILTTRGCSLFSI